MVMNQKLQVVTFVHLQGHVVDKVEEQVPQFGLSTVVHANGNIVAV